ncbi:hypothetical protein COCSADRAFT_297241 [Bipolaris sorokiniana ND90Pr]|uniref:Uncharacterized protein n=1 Tax=Cochliobolus sativus (strain ND90Pr / ATCC 201652) TaxID=665912 RepID=M2TAT3_COCSN|nr:uncharacterized protein COCSADRAFT_297241 [Bipolaris sorokiniana ND90Pr]EMD66326.1 hypothetical protein COCSADRAFT_297241 [Bipolaris sorokiniana ND90Pr]
MFLVKLHTPNPQFRFVVWRYQQCVVSFIPIVSLFYGHGGSTRNTPRSLYEIKVPQQPGYLSPNIIERNVSAFGR